MFELYGTYRSNMKYCNNLAISFSKLGRIYILKGEYKEALSKFREYYKLQKKLCKEFPTNLKFKNSLAISISKLGQVSCLLGEKNEALKYFVEYERITKELFTNSSQNANYRSNYAESILVLWAWKSILKEDNNLGSVDLVKQIWEELLIETQSPYYVKKLDLLHRIIKKDENLEKLVEEILSF